MLQWGDLTPNRGGAKSNKVDPAHTGVRRAEKGGQMESRGTTIRPSKGDSTAKQGTVKSNKSTRRRTGGAPGQNGWPDGKQGNYHPA
jgi:hypothetical protein